VPEDHWSHDIRDPVAFCAQYAKQRDLDYHQRERLVQFLLIALWQLANVYRPGGTITFSTFAGHKLPGRIIDWERSAEEGGRTKWVFSSYTYERTLPEFTEYRPEEADTGRAMDTEGSDLQDLLGLDRARDRRLSRRDDEVGPATKSKAA
jgi:hypothetical protein